MPEISELVTSLSGHFREGLIVCGMSMSDEYPSISKVESQIVATASGKRRHQFACGRACAHRALQKLGKDVEDIGKDQHGAPIWPNGVAGSISHSGDYAVAVVASRTEYSSVGIDIEKTKRMKPSMWSIVFTDREIDWLKSLPSEDSRQQWAAIIFSAKEAFYKCDFPLYREYIGFHKVEMIESSRQGDLRVSCSGLVRTDHYHCSYSRGDDYMITLVCADVK